MRETFADCCASASEEKVRSIAAHATEEMFFFISFFLTPFASRLTLHRITLSALANTFGGIVRPICFAVLRLTTNSNFVGCSTGRSAGLAPLRILSTYQAARLKISASLAE